METAAISIFEHQAFTKIVNSIYTTVYHLSHTYDMGLEIEKLDIEPSLKVMESFVRDIYLRNNNEKNIKTAIEYLITNFNDDIIDDMKGHEYLFILKQYIENKEEHSNQKNICLEEVEDTFPQNENEEEVEDTFPQSENEEEVIENSLSIALFNVKESVNKLYMELSALKESMEYHSKEKYFSSWRTNADISIFLEKLKIYKNIFDERSSLLMKIAAFYI